MKNNIRALVFHLFTVVFVFLLSLLIDANATIRELVYSHLFFKLIVSFLIIMFYYNLGKGMSKRRNRKFDYLTGIFIFLIAVFFGLIAFAGHGSEIFKIPVASSMWRFPLDIFLLPEMYILAIFKIKHNILTFLISAILPGIIFGISIRHSRRRLAKQKRIRRQMENRRKRM